MDDTIDYIKQFLLYGNKEAAQWIGYTRDEAEWSQYKLVIVPGKNLLTGDRHEWDIPDYTRSAHARKQGELYDEFGEKSGGTWVIEEDIIYNTLFLLSQAELTLDLPRDEHGRLSAKHSVLGSQGLYTIPVLDEYSRLCTKLLEQALPDQRFGKIYLTHDVDVLDQYRHLRGFLGAIRRGEFKKAIMSLHDIEEDPAYTFHWLHAQDKKVSGAEEVYFIKATHGEGYDYPQYRLEGGDCTRLLQLLSEEDVVVGLHSSYYASNSKTYKEEKRRVDKVLSKETCYHRSHYLRICEVADLIALANAGITDDFSLGWQDHVGFRFGTTRAARFINPSTLELTPLTLHPLAIMDRTLSNSNYMNIQDEAEAYYTCQQVIDKVRQHGGELSLLWHNSNLGTDNYHRQLYSEILRYLHEA